MVILGTWSCALAWYYLPARLKSRALYFVHRSNKLRMKTDLRCEMKSKVKE